MQSGSRIPDLSPGERQRFWSKVTHAGECWEFQSSQTRGYGRIGLGRRIFLAHRVAFFLATGTNPEGRYVCHHCDNRSCVRPDHLFLGDHASNMDDMNAKGRGRPCGGVWRVGTAHHNAKLTPDAVRRMRALRAEGVAMRELARTFAVSRHTVKHAVTGRTWRHVS